MKKTQNNNVYVRNRIENKKVIKTSLASFAVLSSMREQGLSEARIDQIRTLLVPFRWPGRGNKVAVVYKFTFMADPSQFYIGFTQESICLLST